MGWRDEIGPDSVDGLTESVVRTLDAVELSKAALLLVDEPDNLQRKFLENAIIARSKELGSEREIRGALALCKKEIRRRESKEARAEARAFNDLGLSIDPNGKYSCTIENFFLILDTMEDFSGIRYNVMRSAAEWVDAETGEAVPWKDSHDASIRSYIEENFGIYSENKYRDAMRRLLAKREYNPVLDLVEALEWDGVNRCEHFLSKWALAEDDEYTREVSRLIFAGGINRIYKPGCKFDDVPVLIGTQQGEGKSTLVRWLALRDEFFAEAKEVDGARAVEQIEGAWICEFSEMAAMTKAREQESVKAYITRQFDDHRKPYDRNKSRLPRRCIFVGTSNKEQMLVDQTGNRRFYPVIVHSSGYDLHDHEDECRAYIEQCWAEARVRFKRGEMPPFARRELQDVYKARQLEATEDDWRVGPIEEYLEKKAPGEFVCIIELAMEALHILDEHNQTPTKRESMEISIIVSKIPGWTRCERVRTKYGRQRGWRKCRLSDDTRQVVSDRPF